MRLIALFTLASLPFVYGCATAYQREGFSGGYSETQLGKNIFRVSFNGNGYTGSERASNLALLRAAEVTLENGFKYFILADSEKSSSESTYTTPTQSYTRGSAVAYGNRAYGRAQTTTYGGDTYVISKPGSTNTIICFEEKPDRDGLVFDAAFVAESLRKKYGIGKYEEPSMLPSCRGGEQLVNGVCRTVVSGK